MKTADFPRLLAAFFTDRLMQQLQASPHTIASYRDTFRLLVRHAWKVLNKPPTELELGDLDTDFLGAFLSHLEDQRGNDWSCPSSVDTYPLGEEEESTMPKSRPPYPAAFRQQMVELVRSGRTPGELAREFEPSAEAIRNWVAQADRDAGKRSDGLRTEEHEEIRRLRRENRQLREEREILAKATAWFARETGPGRSTGS